MDPRSQKLVNRYRLIADAMTAVTILIGLAAIVILLLDLRSVGIWLVRVFSIAAMLDFVDGKIARRAGQINRTLDPDTISDYIVFGVLGGLTIYYQSSENSVLAVPAAVLFTGVVFYRLRRFATTPPKKPGNFDGVPAPFGAYVAAVIIPLSLPIWAVISIALLLSALMASTMPYPAFKRKPTPGDLVWIIGIGLIVTSLIITPDAYYEWPVYALLIFMMYYIIMGPFKPHEHVPRD